MKALPLEFLVSLLALAAIPSGACAVEDEAVVLAADPGTVVRWQAAGTTRCEGRSETWPAIGDTCYFPVDLLATGSYQIGRWRGGERETARIEIGAYPYPEEHVEVARSYVELSAQDLERSNRESARIGALWKLESPVSFSLPLAEPLTDLPAGRNFGTRRYFNGEPRNPHSGIDYSATVGTPVLAVSDGTVALAEDHFFGGKTVFIDHGGGLISMSMHLSELSVETGQAVVRGQQIGRVGATGRVSGPHLHFGFRWHGARIDPRVLLPAAGD